MSILDIGCGHGRLMYALAEQSIVPSRILGTELSEQLVRIVNNTASEMGTSNIIEARCVEHDKIVDSLQTERFDLVLSVYAIYYASAMIDLIRDLKNILRPGGSIFVCGYATGTNAEIIQIANKYITEETRLLKPTGDFISGFDCARLGQTYTHVEQRWLMNTIDFLSADEVMQWWRSHNSYRREVDREVLVEVARMIERSGSFSLSKNVLGVILVG